MIPQKNPLFPESDSNKADKTDLTSIIATGSTNTTGATIKGGTYFYLNGTLCRAKTDIAADATFTLNTNYEVVNGALNDIKNKLGTSVDLRSYNTSSNKYTFPHDGYLYIYSHTASGAVGVYLYGSNDVLVGNVIRVNGQFSSQATFVKKGMKIYVGTNSGSDNGVSYAPLI